MLMTSMDMKHTEKEKVCRQEDCTLVTVNNENGVFKKFSTGLPIRRLRWLQSTLCKNKHQPV